MGMNQRAVAGGGVWGGPCPLGGVCTWVGGVGACLGTAARSRGCACIPSAAQWHQAWGDSLPHRQTPSPWGAVFLCVEGPCGLLICSWDWVTDGVDDGGNWVGRGSWFYRHSFPENPLPKPVGTSPHPSLPTFPRCPRVGTTHCDCPSAAYSKAPEWAGTQVLSEHTLVEDVCVRVLHTRARVCVSGRPHLCMPVHWYVPSGGSCVFV